MVATRRKFGISNFLEDERDTSLNEEKGESVGKSGGEELSGAFDSFVSGGGVSRGRVEQNRAGKG